MRLRIQSSEQPGLKASLEPDLLLSPAADGLLKTSLLEMSQTLGNYGLRCKRVQGSVIWMDDDDPRSPVPEVDGTGLVRGCGVSDLGAHISLTSHQSTLYVPICNCA